MLPSSTRSKVPVWALKRAYTQLSQLTIIINLGQKKATINRPINEFVVKIDACRLLYYIVVLINILSKLGIIFLIIYL